MTVRLLLGAASCLLLGVIAMEVSYGTGGGPAAEPGGMSGHKLPIAATPPATTVPRDIAQWQHTVLARPLFNPDRRPAASSVAADAGLPRLAGIIAAPDAAIAIFQPGKGKPVLARAGDTVAGWQVAAVSPTLVSLRKDTDRLALAPSFGLSDAAAVTQQHKPAPSRWEAAAPTGLLRARWSNGQLQP